MNALALLCAFVAVFSVFSTSSSGITFSPEHLIAHHISKRQTANNSAVMDPFLDCSTIIFDYQCGPSGYAQQLVDIGLGCGNDSYARGTADTCARNVNGKTCGEASVRFFSSNAELVSAGSCSDVIISGSCSSTCRNFLESTSSKLGCCVNVNINTTSSPFSGLFDYRLWNLCDVPLPPEFCEDQLSLDPPQNVQDCSSEEFVSRLVDYQCMPSVGQPLVNALLQDERCIIFATAVVDACSTNANGQPCAEVIGLDFLSISDDPLLGSLLTNCSDSVETCSPSCQSAVTNIADAYGCCVNIYNSTVTGIQLPSLSYSLWNSCGVDSPGFCNSSLTTSLDPSPTPTILASTDTPEETTTQETSASSTSPSTTLESDSPTSGSKVLTSVNWIVLLSLLHLKEFF